MKKSLAILLFACAAVAVLPSCNTYEDGPGLSFRSKYSRVVNNWKTKTVMRGLVDVTAWYEDYQIDMREDGRMTLTNRDALDSLYTIDGFWDLVNDNKDLRLLYANPPVNPDRVTYQILRLKEDELWIQEDQDSVVWEYRFVPVEG
jgi:hypothetical protein